MEGSLIHWTCVAWKLIQELPGSYVPNIHRTIWAACRHLQNKPIDDFNVDFTLPRMPMKSMNDNDKLLERGCNLLIIFLHLRSWREITADEGQRGPPWCHQETSHTSAGSSQNCADGQWKSSCTDCLAHTAACPKVWVYYPAQNSRPHYVLSKSFLFGNFNTRQLWHQRMVPWKLCARALAVILTQ